MDEFEIIKRFFSGPVSYRHDGVLIGPGDDCAVVRVPRGSEICVSVDTLIAGIHFPESASADMIASRAMGVSLSDLAAMGAEPSHMDPRHSWLEPGFQACRFTA